MNKNKKPYTEEEMNEFIRHSNWIENERSKEAFQDAKKAWLFAVSLTEITENSLLMIHRILLRRLRPDIAGEYRDCPVMIGGKVKKYFGREVISAQVNEVLKLINESIKNPPLLTGDKERICKELHIKFEDVHPHEDCNGRTGRMVMGWQRIMMGLPLLIIHSDWPKEDGETAKYYEWFR